jgi:hypothetical protein
MKKHVRIVLGLALAVMAVAWVGLLSSNADLEKQATGAKPVAAATTNDDGGAS